MTKVTSILAPNYKIDYIPSYKSLIRKDETDMYAFCENS